jgi:2-polyprenyl-3-methyl-5-hydroxy-6-metoxy-1,4-benzoquinol methylase
MWMPVRARQPELMDLPKTDGVLLERTLHHLEVVNRLLLGARRVVRRFILEDLGSNGNETTSTLLDIGAGGCAIGRWLARTRDGLPARLRVVCLDHDPRVIAHLRSLCSGTPSIEIRLGSSNELANMERFDYMFANLFLHHLRDEQIVSLLNVMLRKTRRLFVINDLLRSPLSYAGYCLFSAVFLHRSFAAADGRLSIRKGFLREELQELMARTDRPARLALHYHFPGQLCIVGRP